MERLGHEHQLALGYRGQQGHPRSGVPDSPGAWLEATQPTQILHGTSGWRRCCPIRPYVRCCAAQIVDELAPSLVFGPDGAGMVDEDRVVMELTATTRDPCELCGCRIGERRDRLKKIDAMATHNDVRICRTCVKRCTDILADDLGQWKITKQ